MSFFCTLSMSFICQRIYLQAPNLPANNYCSLTTGLEYFFFFLVTTCACAGFLPQQFIFSNWIQETRPNFGGKLLFFSGFLFVYFITWVFNFLLQFHFSYKREIMSSDKVTESVVVSFLWCWQGCFYEFVLFLHILSSKVIKCCLQGLFFRKIASHANTKAHVPQNIPLGHYQWDSKFFYHKLICRC